MKVLHYVAKATGGRGKKGGLSEYASLIGKDLAHLTRYRQAATVVETLASAQGFVVSELLDKSAHLAAIHRLPQDAWPQAGAARRAGWTLMPRRQVCTLAISPPIGLGLRLPKPFY